MLRTAELKKKLKEALDDEADDNKIKVTMQLPY